ncbi:hypothetical protein [Weissella cibaria]|uniref:hypothetical protein n=1 Tax=Weissella cibaria TaxID=137591 RepID=UPI0013D95CB3|nr:hypothetical protein [Weissella cibaria]NFA02014.1 hypothetical protein [Weissella cibaria]
MSVKDEAIKAGWEFVKSEIENQKAHKNPEMLNSIAGLIAALNGSSINTNVTVPDNNIMINGVFDAERVADVITQKLEGK